MEQDNNQLIIESTDSASVDSITLPPSLVKSDLSSMSLQPLGNVEDEAEDERKPAKQELTKRKGKEPSLGYKGEKKDSFISQQRNLFVAKETLRSTSNPSIECFLKTDNQVWVGDANGRAVLYHYIVRSSFN